MRSGFMLSLFLFSPGLLHAQLITAEELLVEIVATNAPPGPLSFITNHGTLAGGFEATGGGSTVPEIIRIGGSNGTACIRLDGFDFMQHVDGPGGVLQLAHPGIVGPDPTASIEVWVINNTIWSEETLLAWGRRGGGCGSNMAFNYGTNPSHGSIGHWCGQDLGWGPVVTPPARRWHHLVYSFDGATQRVYMDGVLQASELLGGGAVNTHTNTPITLAAQLNANTTVNNELGGSLLVGKIRIHDGVLSDTDVLGNYNAEAADFVIAAPTNLVAGPVHRWRFSNPLGPAVGALVPDEVGDADAVVRGFGARFTGGKIELPGGVSGSAAYIDLPNGIISTNGAAKGGSGQVTVEGWYTHRGNHNWSRIFDFGSTTSGELPDVGGAGNGFDVFLFSAQNGGDMTRKRLQFLNNDPVGGGAGLNQYTDLRSYDENQEYHFAITWDESSGDVRIYENGLETAGMNTTMQIGQLNDVNNWLGRSNWTSDGNLQGDFDEVRIYDRVLSPEEVQGSFITGPDLVDTTGQGRGALLAIRAEVAFTNLFPGTTEQVAIFADYENASNINVTASNIIYAAQGIGVIEVDPGGLVRALQPGSEYFAIQFETAITTLTLQVIEPAATLMHRYSFTSNLVDSVGGADAVSPNGHAFSGDAIALESTLQQYLHLPAGLIDGYYALTVEAWASFGVNPVWARLFDFGSQTASGAGQRYAMFSPHGNGGISRIQMTNDGPGGALPFDLDMPYTLDGRTHVHVVCVFHPRAQRMQLYLDGCLVAERNDVTDTLERIDSTLLWIGRSLYGTDPYLQASVDEFRIYDGVLDALAVGIHGGAGPDALPPGDPGPVVALHLAAAPTMSNEDILVPDLFVDYASVSNVNACSLTGVVYTSSDSSVAVFDPDGRVIGLLEGTTTLRASLGGQDSNPELVTVTRARPLDLVHRYPFTGTSDDVVGGAHGALTNFTGTSAYTNGTLVLGNDGSQRSNSGGDYVNLPNGMISSLGTNATFECWFTWNGPGASNWQRIFDFGLSDGGENTAPGAANVPYIFLTPYSGGNTIFGYQVSPPRQERRITYNVAHALGGETHSVVVWDGERGTVSMYLDGVFAGSGALHMQLSDLNDLNNWLGRSQFNDPYLTGAYNEFRIWSGAMTEADVLASFVSGPDALDSVPEVNLRVTRTTDGRVRVAWPSSLTGYTLEVSGHPAGPFVPAAGLVETTEGLETAAYDDAPGPYRVYRLRLN